jgi:hypothetical protein
VPEGVAMDSERARRADQVPGRQLDGARDVFLLELLASEIETDAVGEELVDYLLKFCIEIHAAASPFPSFPWPVIERGADITTRAERESI